MDALDLPQLPRFGPFGPAFDAGIEAELAVDTETARILDANPAACRLLGHAREALKAMQIFDLHPGQASALVVFTQAVMDRGAHWTRSLTPHHADGRPLRLEYAGIQVSSPRGRTLLITLHDLEARHRRDIDADADSFMREGIAEWQRVDRFFRDIERENRLILHAVGEGIYGVNSEGKTTFVNPAAEQILGWTA
ncbi:MAG: histidine kinase, partial [Rhizobiales bacterium 24-66-13]